jgi:hypothetical protein
MKRTWKRILLFCGAILLILLIALGVLFQWELRSLISLNRLDAHPLYQMNYRGDYGFSDFLTQGASNDKEIERFVTQKLLKGLKIDLNIASAGCSAFSASNEQGERIFARNFDFDYAPALLLKTDPSDGFAVLSIVNLAFAGYGEGNLPDDGLVNRFLTLAGPYLPFDGVNEKGVAMALLAVPHAEPPQEPGRVMLNTTTAIRLVLDRAESVSQALSLLEDYNLYFSGGVECHFLIADASGDSAIVEFLDGKMCVTRNTDRFQAVTNFIVYQGRNEGEGGDEFVRFDTIQTELEKRQGIISEEGALELLSSAKIPGRTQWSAVYNLSTGEVMICMAEHYDTVYRMSLRDGIK